MPACFIRKVKALTIQAKTGLRAGRSSSRRAGNIMSLFISQRFSPWLSQSVFKGSSYQTISNTFSLRKFIILVQHTLRHCICLLMTSTEESATSRLIQMWGADEKHSMCCCCVVMFMTWQFGQVFILWSRVLFAQRQTQLFLGVDCCKS